MKRLIPVLAVSFFCSLSFGCNGTHEDVVKEEKKAQKEVGAAKVEVLEQKVESKKDIEDARAQGNLKAIEAAKIEATKELAEAESKVDEKKLDATKAITGAKKDAGETSGTFQRD